MSKVPTITVTGQGSASMPPDRAIVTFQVAFVHRDYEQAVADVNEHVQRLRGALRGVSVDPDQLKTTRFEVSPRHETKKVGENRKQVFVGWNAQQHLRLELGIDSRLLSQALTAIAQCEVESSLGLSFEVTDQAGLRARVLADATRVACLNARTIAEASGCRLGKPLRIKYGWSHMSYDSLIRYDRENIGLCSSMPDVRPADVEVQDSVTIVFAIE